MVEPLTSNQATRVRFSPPALRPTVYILLLPVMKTAEREEARRLRREEGRSVGEIQRLLGVSRSSASVWVRDIELTALQKQALRERDPALNAHLNGSAERARHFRDLRRGYQTQGRELARSGDTLHAAGCMLYWAEGDKSRNRVALSNADPRGPALLHSVPTLVLRCAG